MRYLPRRSSATISSPSSFAALDPVAALRVTHDAHSVVDHVLLPEAARTEADGGVADADRAQARDVAVARTQDRIAPDDVWQGVEVRISSLRVDPAIVRLNGRA